MDIIKTALCVCSQLLFSGNEQVQLVGLVSLSCNWVILHNEIDHIKVQIHLNPTCIVLYYKNLSKH